MNDQNLITPNQPSNLPNASASLVLGIISIVGVFCYLIPGVVCGIIGLVLANKDRRLYQAAPEMYAPSSYSSSNAGRTCSIIGLSIAALLLVLVIVWFAIFGSFIMAAARHGYNG